MCAREVHVCCAPNAVKLITRLIEECGDSHELKEYERDTELIFQEGVNFEFPGSIEKGNALIAFSKRMVFGISSILAERGYKVSVTAWLWSMPVTRVVTGILLTYIVTNTIRSYDGRGKHDR